MRTSQDQPTWAFVASSPVGCAPSLQVTALALTVAENCVKLRDDLLRAGLRARATDLIPQQTTHAK
jgi:hypothetical protein